MTNSLYVFWFIVQYVLEHYSSYFLGFFYMKVIESTNESFLEDIAQGKVVVDVYSTSCYPCKMFASTFENVSERVEDANFVKLNADDAYEHAVNLGISSVPTIIIFEDGKEIKRTTGVMASDAFIDWIG